MVVKTDLDLNLVHVLWKVGDDNFVRRLGGGANRLCAVGSGCVRDNTGASGRGCASGTEQLLTCSFADSGATDGLGAGGGDLRVGGK